MKIMNVDDMTFSIKHGTYGGKSCLKDGLVIEGKNWLIKYPKNANVLQNHAEMLYTNDTVSEFLGSHVYQLLGYPVHETMLVERRGKIAVACRDFVDFAKSEQLIEIRTLKNSANSKLAEILERDFSSTGSIRVVELDEILLHLKENELLNRVPGIVERFWDMVVVDAFINNNDRNNGNWGILRNSQGEDRLAPIFDNGGSFNGKTPDSRLERLFNSGNVKSSSLNGISIFGKDDVNYTCRQLLDLDNQDLKSAVVRNYKKIRDAMPQILDLIDNLPDIACSTIRKEFYKESLTTRLEFLLYPTYSKCLKENELKHPTGF